MTPLKAAVAAFHARVPPRIWSLIVSFIGDTVLPRGGNVQAGIISDFCALADVEPGLVRTALSRLVAKGILARERDGRKSFYRLTEPERHAFDAAADLIYGRVLPRPDGRWDVLLIDQASDRAKLRETALAEGFAPFGPASLLRPHHQGRGMSAVGGALGIVGEADDALDAARIWPISDLSASYRRLIARYGALNDAEGLAPGDAVLARVLLVHDFRRILLRDPFLPKAALPQDWPAEEARALFDRLYADLSPGAERWIDSAISA